MPLIAEALAFLGFLILLPNLWLVVALFSVVGAGTCALLPCLWNFPTLLLSDAAAAAAIGLMNTFGSLEASSVPTQSGISIAGRIPFLPA